MPRYRLPLLSLMALTAYENALANAPLEQAAAMSESSDPGWAYDNSRLRAAVRAETAGRHKLGNGSYLLASTPAGQAHAAMQARAIPSPKKDKEGGLLGKLGGLFSGKSLWLWGGGALGAVIGIVAFSGFWPVLIGAALGLGAGWLASKFF